MRYCNRGDIARAIPAVTLRELTNDDPAADLPDEAVIEEAVRQAEELIDGYLRGRYNLPLDPVPTIIRDSVVYLARYWIYQRRPEGAGIPDAVKDSQKNTLELLANVRDGRISLGMPDGKTTPEPGEIRVRSRARQFGSDRWRSY